MNTTNFYFVLMGNGSSKNNIHDHKTTTWLIAIEHSIRRSVDRMTLLVPNWNYSVQNNNSEERAIWQDLKCNKNTLQRSINDSRRGTDLDRGKSYSLDMKFYRCPSLRLCFIKRAEIDQNCHKTTLIKGFASVWYLLITYVIMGLSICLLHERKQLKPILLSVAISEITIYQNIN